MPGLKWFRRWFKRSHKQPTDFQLATVAGTNSPRKKMISRFSKLAKRLSKKETEDGQRKLSSGAQQTTERLCGRSRRAASANTSPSKL